MTLVQAFKRHDGLCSTKWIPLDRTKWSEMISATNPMWIKFCCICVLINFCASVDSLGFKNAFEFECN